MGARTSDKTLSHASHLLIYVAAIGYVGYRICMLLFMHVQSNT